MSNRKIGTKLYKVTDYTANHHYTAVVCANSFSDVRKMFIIRGELNIEFIGRAKKKPQMEKGIIVEEVYKCELAKTEEPKPIVPKTPSFIDRAKKRLGIKEKDPLLVLVK